MTLYLTGCIKYSFGEILIVGLESRYKRKNRYNEKW